MQLFIVRKTAAEFTQENEIIPENMIAAETDFEAGVRVDTGKVKLGDGSRHYNDLPYFNSSAPYDLARQVSGKPSTGALVLQLVAVRAFTLSADLHRAISRVAATAQADFVIKKNSDTIGTIRFAAAGTVATIVSGVETSFVAGDVVTVTAPTQDATLEDIAFTLYGTQYLAA